MTAESDLEQRLRQAEGINRLARVITSGGDGPTILQAMVEIIGEALDVDRSLIYDIRYPDEVADGLCEWLNPAAEGIQPTVATYPLSQFQGGADECFQTRTWIESHVDAVHPALQGDGSAEILHGPMQIKSLLWFPFDFEEDRFYGLIFNQVRHRRTWQPLDIEFISSVAEMVSMVRLRVRLEAEARERERRSEQLQRLEGLGLLAGGIAHDFNNLLTAIVGNASLAAARLPQGSPVSPMLIAIEDAAAGAGELCKQLLTYSGRGSASMQLIDLGATIRSMSELLRISVKRDAEIERELAEGPLWINGDAAQVQQVVLNLMTNASDALEGDGGLITVRAGSMHVQEATARGVRFASPPTARFLHFIEVADDGRGMDSATQRRIFEPFFTTRPQGHGLGLAAVHGILAAHGGGIGVRSEPGKGARFLVAFPDAHGGPHPPETTRPARTAAATVLVVDDQEIVRSVCESALTLDGYRVLKAASGLEAIAVCAAKNPPVDAVVLDLAMPRMDGRQTLAKLREDGHAFPVLMISAYGIDEALGSDEAENLGFLQKPFRPDDLLSAVAALLSQRSRS